MTAAFHAVPFIVTLGLIFILVVVEIMAFLYLPRKHIGELIGALAAFVIVFLLFMPFGCVTGFNGPSETRCASLMQLVLPGLPGTEVDGVNPLPAMSAATVMALVTYGVVHLRGGRRGKT